MTMRRTNALTALLMLGFLAGCTGGSMLPAELILDGGSGQDGGGPLVVTATGDSHETISPSGAQTVNRGATQAFFVTPNPNYTVSTTVGGTCPAGPWNGNTYTTGPITADCTVAFTATLNTYEVTAFTDPFAVISPSAPQRVPYGATQAYAVTLSPFYTLETRGTCAAGTWADNVYTTGPITADCNVVFQTTPKQYVVTVTTDAGESVSPNTPQTVILDSKPMFVVTALPGYVITVGGTCPMGMWLGWTYTTGNIESDCTVAFTSTLNTYQITSSGDGNETISPSNAQTVGYGHTQAYTVTPATGYTVSPTVGGTCPVGSWNGDVYTTDTIGADCTVIFSATLNAYLVSATTDAGESISPNTDQWVNYGGTQTYTVTQTAGYTVSSVVGGTCPGGSWSGNTYTTGIITANCSVTFSATLNSYQITPSGDGNETITPNDAQTVNYGGARDFTVTPATGYTVSTTVGGTCPGGSWSGSTYTIGAITANCTVTFSATLNTYVVMVTNLPGVLADPPEPRMVSYGSTLSYVVTPGVGYSVSTMVGGTCPAGSWSGSTYTTGTVTADCEVVFSGTVNTYQVSVTTDGFEAVSPNTNQMVNYHSTQAYTVAATTGYTVSATVGGTCPAGSWSGNTYTTGFITADCTVSFSATLNTYQVTASGDGNETISPSGAQTVNYNSTRNFIVTPMTGYTGSTTVGGTCPAGSWNGTTYTTGLITANCTVSFSATPNPPGAPTIGTAIGDYTQAFVYFTPPTDSGSQPITSYTLTSSPDGLTQTGTSLPIIVTGLSAGTSYTFTVTATSAIGTGAPSAPSNAVLALQAPQVSTLAGGGASGVCISSYTCVGGPNSTAAFNSPSGLAVDAQGNVYVGDTYGNAVRKISNTHLVTTLASALNGVFDVALDGAGNIYVADTFNQKVKKIDSTGTLSLYAGDGTAGYLDGLAGMAEFNQPEGVAVDSVGNVYVADSTNSCIRMIDPSGTVSTFAGNGTYGSHDGTGGAHGTAEFKRPSGVAVDAQGNVYVADGAANNIRVITNSSGVVTVSTIAGDGTAGYLDGEGIAAKFSQPWAVALDTHGNLYVADSNNNRIRMVTTAAPFTVTTLAGNGTAGYMDGTPGATGTAQFSYPMGVAVDAAGNVYVGDWGNNRIRKIAAGP